MPNALDLVKQLDKSSLESILSHTYNSTAKRFADKSSGRFLSKTQAIALIDKGINDNRANLQTLSADLSSGKIDIVKFLTEGSQAIKDLHILNTVKVLDGRADQISASQLTILKNRVKQELTGGKDDITGDRFGMKYLIRDILKGDVSAAQLSNRLNMYADSAALTQNHIEADQKKDSGMTEGFRILGANDRTHCLSCVNLATLNWVKIEDLVMPGDQCECRSNCKCEIIYR